MRCLCWASLVMRMNKTKVYVSDTKFLKDKSVFGELYQTVSPNRQRKIDAFLFEKDKQLCLAAELILKKALSHAGIDHYTVKRGALGKPYLEKERICFNLSHSEEMVMCAISSKEVGCDVEKVTDIDLEIAKRFFYTTEYEAIKAAQSEAERRNMFFRLWTLKESFMKATGLGMKLPLDSFRIGIEGGKLTVCQNVNQEKYFFKEYDFNNGYKYAVCSLTDKFGDAELVSLV